MVLATNIAETSVTIPGVKHVVDSCRVKAKLHQAGAGLDLLKVVRVSKAQTKQRTCRESEGTLSESPQHQEKCVISHVFLTLP